MDNSGSITRFAGGVLAGLLICFCLQGIAFFGMHFGTGKTESNYFSTISRFQGACAPGAELAIAGSSISGRLPGRESGNRVVANLGSDGGSPIDGIILIEEGIVGRPHWLVVEVNTLFNGAGYSEKPAVSSARGWWFAMGDRFPLLGAAARPSGMLYARFLGREWKGPGEPFPLETKPLILRSPAPPFEFNPVEAERLKTLIQKLIAIRQTGVKVLLVKLPAGEMTPYDQARLAASVHLISGEIEEYYLDLAAQIPRELLVFTDSVHLGPASASRILDTIQASCRALDYNNHK